MEDDKLSAAAGWNLAKVIRRMVGQNLSGADRSKNGTATLVRRDADGTAWVMMPGANAETPVNGTEVAGSQPGDLVTWRLEDGRLSITGNATDPAVGMTGLASSIAGAKGEVLTLLNRTIGSVTSIIMATADGILTVVSTKVGQNEVISRINQSPEEIDIDAGRVNIEGAAIFTNGRLSEASLNSTYDAYGAGAQAETAAIAAQNTANGANAKEQLIYKSATDGTTSMSGSTQWCTDATGLQNRWTTKRPEYSSSYPVMFVATQRQTVTQAAMGNVTNNCSCTTPHIDDTTTVIDGGHLINYSITTNKLAAGSVTIGKIDTSDSDTAEALLNRPTWGYCDSKVSGYNDFFAVDADGFELIDGSEIAVYFDIAHSNYYFELDVNDTGHKPVVVNGVASGHGMGHISFNAGSTLTFRYYGNAYYLIDKAGTIDGACSTAHGTATKVVTVDGPFLLMDGTILNVHFSTKNSYASGAIYLSVGGNVSKVYVDELGTSSSNTLLWDANKVLSFVYRNDYWYFVGVSNASKTATDYITHIDNNGVKVHDSGDTSNYLHLTSSGTDIYVAGSLAARFAASLIELGRNSASSVIKMCAGMLTITTTAATGSSPGSSDIDSQGGLHLTGHPKSSDGTWEGRAYIDAGGVRWNSDGINAGVQIGADSDPDGTAGDNLEHKAYIDVDGGYAGSSAGGSTSSYIQFSADRILLTASKWLEALGGYTAKTALTLNTTNCQAYDAYSTPYYEKRAGLVIVSGAVKPKSTVASGGEMVIATLPDGCRPVQATTTLCQGSNGATWLLEIKTYNNQPGTMVASRYRNGSTNAQMTTSTWLPFHVVFPIQ